jgi:putative oxidoreductase
MRAARIDFTGVADGVRSAIDWLEWIARAVAPPLLRIALAIPFFRSGLTK